VTVKGRARDGDVRDVDLGDDTRNPDGTVTKVENEFGVQGVGLLQRTVEATQIKEQASTRRTVRPLRMLESLSTRDQREAHAGTGCAGGDNQ
jgi:hypothetical protein